MAGPANDNYTPRVQRLRAYLSVAAVHAASLVLWGVLLVAEVVQWFKR